MKHPSLFFALLLALALGACGDDLITDAAVADGAVEDGGVDGESDGGVCETPEAFVEGGEGHADPLGVGAGEARAGRVRADQLPADPNDLAVWAGDDWVLANEHIAVVIEDSGDSDGYDPWGGKIIGITRVEGGALVEPADYNEAMVGVGRFSAQVTHVGVLNDGTDGNAAVVRAIGPMTALPFVDNFAQTIFPGIFDGISVAIDYILEPGAEKVELRYTFRNESMTREATQATLLAFQKERMPAFAPDLGFAVTGAVDYVGFAKAGVTSYALDSPISDWSLLLEISGTMLFTGGSFNIEPCELTEVDLATIYVGGPGQTGLQAAHARENGVTLRTVTGRVEEAGGDGAAGVRVHAFSGATYYSRAMTDETGAFSINLPTGTAVTLGTWRRGDLSVQTSLAADANNPTLTLGDSGFIEVRATEGGEPVPVRVQVGPAAGMAQAPPREWGESTLPGGRMHIVFPGVEAARVRVPAGRHRVIVSRGFEYELGLNEDVTVRAGETTALDVEMQRVVDTTDIMCADYHIHTFRSPDAPDPARFKVLSAAGDGLEIPLRSEHEWVHEWESLIEDENLATFAFGVTSLELTTFEWGHFGVFPLEPDPTQPNRGAPAWYYQNPPDVFDTVRAGPTAPSVIINHPRSLAGQGYFTAAGYDATTGTVARPELWDEEFSVVEFFNDSSFDENEVLVADWFSFLSTGRRVWAVGSSDSHKVQNASPVGYPRTCLDMGMDSPAALRAGGGAALLQQRTQTGQFFVSGGIYLDVVARDGVRPGGDVTSAGDTELVMVRVQAPSWIDVDSLELWVDGAMVMTMPVEAGDGVDRGTYEISVPVSATGSWAIFHAKGDLPLDPVYFGRFPFAVSMPIFFER